MSYMSGKKQEKRILEVDRMKNICTFLENRGMLFWRNNNISVFGRNNAGNMVHRAMPKFARKGVPDIILIFRGYFIGLEVKQPKNEQSPDQIKFEQDVIKHGGFYHVVHDTMEVADLLHYYSELLPAREPLI